ncbi:hypothetical protein IQ07DRAFT_260579 [Pyrenochaeta sp. DS3sAY3a]|nr:hypothetical protein IQ07DRAFT_260579 [Pyrenochaeta sp. DS3sAY3a]
MDKDISRKNLRRHGIYYEPNVYQGNHENTGSTAHSLPDHVDAVRDGLLLMEKILPEDCNATLLEDFDEFGSADIGPDWCLRPPPAALVRGTHYERMRQESASHDNLKSCEKIVERAKNITTNSEAEWSHFWRRHMFKLFSDDAPEHSSLSPTFDRWSVYENVRWNEYGNVVKPHHLAPNRTLPQPDLTYAFPIQTSIPETFTGFARDELTQSLSLESLRKLAAQGVACAPKTALRKSIRHPTGTNWSSSDASCFPWAIVEMKKTVSARDRNAIDRCYSQAANAAAAALDIQAQLFDKLKDSDPFQRPPVVAFTCVGPVVKVWLAYQDRSGTFASPMQRMVCIWSTSVDLIWGVASLRAIIKNMHTWSSRLLKPKLQAAILQASSNISKRDRNVCDLTSAFESAGFENIFRDHGPTFGTAGTPFSAHIEWDKFSTCEQYQTITFQSPYQDYSLEELRMADYDRGRRYRPPSNAFAQPNDTSSTKRNHSDNPDDGPFGALRPRASGLARRFMKDASHRTDDSARSTSSPGLNTPEDTRAYHVDGGFANPDDEEDDDDSSSDTPSSSLTPQFRVPIVMERLIKQDRLQRIISGLKKSQLRQIMRGFETRRNPDGTYSVPIAVLVRRVNMFLNPADRISSDRGQSESSLNAKSHITPRNPKAQ